MQEVEWMLEETGEKKSRRRSFVHHWAVAVPEDDLCAWLDNLEPMVKLSGGKEHSKAVSAPATSLICYICGASNANWPVYSHIRNPPNTPFFPFLDYHEPAPGCRSMDRRTGRVDACTVCFSFLTQQWHTYEANETPLIKRLYWLKRSGTDPNNEKKDPPQESNKAVNAKDLDRALKDVEAQQQSAIDEGHESENHGHLEEVRAEEKEANFSSPVAQDEHPARSTPAVDVPKSSGSLETCFICSRQKPKEFMRSVHTRPQLKTETPFYPCLARHTPVPTARKMDYLGKVLVCEACQKFLFRQWQVFQKNITPLGERQYQLRSDPSLPREQQSQLSTMVCFICGVTQPATSGRFLYSCKHTPGDPYYPFLARLKPPPGAMPLTKQGLTRVCSGCRKSLHRQWKHYEAQEVKDDHREYHFRNEVVGPDLSAGRSSELSAVACYTCGESCSESNLHLLHTKPNTNLSTASLYFPFIANLKPPPNSRPIDQTGRAFVCKECHRCIQEKWCMYEKTKIPLEDRVYSLRPTNLQEEPPRYCFLCATNCNPFKAYLLHSYPQCGEGVMDGGPFFPFLSNREPAPSAQPIDSGGVAATCEICYNNLMAQWYSYESSNIPEENNRWLRKYRVTHVVCYLCGNWAHRKSSGAVNKLLITFSKKHRPTKWALLVNEDRDVVLCQDCQRAVKSDLEATEDGIQAGQEAQTIEVNKLAKNASNLSILFVQGLGCLSMIPTALLIYLFVC